MGQYKKLWYALIAVLIVPFSILGYLGTEVYRQAPPFPDKYVTASGETCRPVCLAEHRRYGSRFGNGSRRIPGAGLDGRLAAP